MFIAFPPHTAHRPAHHHTPNFLPPVSVNLPVFLSTHTNSCICKTDAWGKTPANLRLPDEPVVVRKTVGCPETAGSPANAFTGRRRPHERTMTGDTRFERKSAPA
jgi:hypothetical protein